MAKEIVILTNLIPHYRYSFYRSLNEKLKNKITILTGCTKNTQWRSAARNIDGIKNMSLVEKHFFLANFQLIWQKGLLNTIYNINPSIIILSGISGYLTNWLVLIISKIKKNKTIMWSCGWEKQAPNTLSYFIKRFLLKKYQSLADYHIVYSTNAKKALISNGIDSATIRIAYNGIDVEALSQKETSIYRQSTILKHNQCYKDKQIFLYTGVLLEEKRVTLLIEAFYNLNELYNNLYLWIVGDGPLLADLKILCHSKGIENVMFWGKDEETVDKYFAACDFFVLPGIGGLALNQAMFWKKPCIVSTADGTEDDLVKDGINGFRFKSGSIESLTSAMLKVLQLSQNEIADMGERNREIILKRSNTAQMVDTFMKVIDLCYK